MKSILYLSCHEILGMDELILFHELGYNFFSPGENDLHAYKTGLKDAKGEKNGRAKLTEEVVKKIRALASNGDHYSQIARSFGITPSHCYAIITKKCWRHVV